LHPLRYGCLLPGLRSYPPCTLGISWIAHSLPCCFFPQMLGWLEPASTKPPGAGGRRLRQQAPPDQVAWSRHQRQGSLCVFLAFTEGHGASIINIMEVEAPTGSPSKQWFCQQTFLTASITTLLSYRCSISNQEAHSAVWLG